jgi:hypothetical protein
MAIDRYHDGVDAIVNIASTTKLGQPNMASLEFVSPTFALERRC